MNTLANKKFRVTANSKVKDLGSNTILTLNQEGNLLFGQYEGGKVLRGNFIAKLIGNSFQKFFHHYNSQGLLISGESSGTIEMLENGKVRLHESWNSDLTDCDVIYDELDGLKTDNNVSEYYYQLSMNK